MKIAKVFYYYYYLFYTKVIPDEQPNATVIFALSFIQSLWINAIIDSLALAVFCYKVSKWIMIIIAVMLIGMNYWYFHKNNDVKEIVNSKPKFFNNHRLTIIIVLAFSIIGVSWMFWGSIFAKNILQNCS